MSRNKLRIRQGDTVKVITGRERGTIARVLRTVPEDRKIFVEGVRVVKRHQKPAGEQPGGIIQKEAAIDISNVALWNAEEGRCVKVGYAEIDGKKVRIDRSTGAPVGGEA